jgi:hypothetical protein
MPAYDRRRAFYKFLILSLVPFAVLGIAFVLLHYLLG